MVTRRLAKFVLLGTLLGGVFAATAVAAFETPATVSVGAVGSIDAKTAKVSVTVTCTLTTQIDGAVTVDLSQGAGSKAAAGTGSATISCDGQSHTYRVAVPASSGHWHSGSVTAVATASANGTLLVEACSSDPMPTCVQGNVPAHAGGSAGPIAVTLANG